MLLTTIIISKTIFTQDHWCIVDEATKAAKIKRDEIYRSKNKCLEGLGKAPAFYPVLLHILNLVSKNHRRYNFYILIFLFMLNTGQRFVTASNVMVTGIKDVI